MMLCYLSFLNQKRVTIHFKRCIRSSLKEPSNHSIPFQMGSKTANHPNGSLPPRVRHRLRPRLGPRRRPGPTQAGPTPTHAWGPAPLAVSRRRGGHAGASVTTRLLSEARHRRPAVDSFFCFCRYNE